MNMNHRITLKKTQRGTVLVVGLLLLFIMTLIGVTAMKTTSLDEKMAGNMRDRSLAFQSAESVLRDGEVILDELRVDEIRSFRGANGHYYKSRSFPSDIFDHTTTWTSSKSAEYSGNALSSVPTKPRYMANVVIDRSILDMDLAGKGLDYAVIQVTSRGTGGSNESQVLLRTHFGKRY